MGQDRRSGRRRRCARARARAAARRRDRPARRRLPAALPRRSPSPADASSATTVARCPGPARAVPGHTPVTVLDVAGRTAIGCASSTFRRPSIATGSTATRTATTPTTPGGSGCSAGPRSRRFAPTAAPSTSSTCTTGTPARRPIFRDALVRRRPDHRAGGDPDDAAQPRLPRLDAATRACPSSGSRRATGPPGRNADGIDLLRAGIERAELVNTVSPGFAREALTPAFGMGLDGLLREMGDRFLGILNGLDTRSGIRPPTRTSPRRTPGATSPARRPAGPTCSTRIGFEPERSRARSSA